MKAKEKRVYTGIYRDVNFSIQRFDGFDMSGNTFSWTHYIHLDLDKQIKDRSIADKFWLEPEYDEKNRVSYEYYSSIISDIEFHGGCTYYSKESSMDDKSRLVKIGCDYQHSWDDGQEYSLPYIQDQVKKTIDSLLTITPVLKWCNGCGVFYEDVSKNGCGKCEYSKDKY